MTQRNEEWAKTVTDHGDGVTCPNCPHHAVLVMEVIDESVRMLPEVLAGVQGEVYTPERHNAVQTLTYRDAVLLIHEHGYRPIDLTTREPIEDWKPPKQWQAKAPETKRLDGPPENKGRGRGRG